MHGCRHALVPSIIGKDRGQILIECAHRSLQSIELTANYIICILYPMTLSVHALLDTGDCTLVPSFFLLEI